MGLQLLDWLPVLVAAGVVALAQLKVRERAQTAALFLSAGAGLEVVWSLAQRFVLRRGAVASGDELDLPLSWTLGPLMHAAAVGCVVWGLVQLADALFPRGQRGLPALLRSVPEESPNKFLLGFVGFFALAGIFSSMGRAMPVALAGGALAVVAVLVGSFFLQKHGGSVAMWVLERRPDLVVWVYVHQLKVINRQTGMTSVHWSTKLGLSNGVLVTMPGFGADQSQTFAAGVAEHCPGITVGFSPENAARFNSQPASMRGGARAP
ncbi:MAG: hypothetical protein AB1938_17005 [Myxococcota bacterium]